ncbi:MAG: hypothetical protein EOS81_31520 [Mesorhizobium sp.]|uniref:hypothetical protein n=1 Tax=Mesorhizobium sp. TaxID=1871066 RepID=UPI000FE61AC7|nr:MAG: hypothetical protein EOS81_31520 [Mesorhizobium sp.]
MFDDDDYAYARLVANRYPALPVYLQVGNPAPLITHAGPGSDEAPIDDLMRRFRWLVDKVAGDGWFTATVLLQLHVLAWGNMRRLTERS